MNRHVARLAKLCATYGENSLIEVYIWPVQMQSLIHPHSSHGEKAEESGVGGGTKSFRRWKLRCAAEQTRNLFVAIYVRRLSLIPMRKKPGCRDLCSRFRRTVPRGEAPDHAPNAKPTWKAGLQPAGSPIEAPVPL